MKKFAVKIIFFLIFFQSNAFGQDFSDTASNLGIDIELNRDTISSIDSLKIIITLTNISNDTIKILFDKPEFHTGGLWYEYKFKLTNSKDSSVLYSGNSGELASVRLKSKSELKDFLYQIPPKGQIKKEYTLSELIVIKPIGRALDDGKYKLILTNYNSTSNTVEFEVVKKH